MAANPAIDLEQRLQDDIARFAMDPYGFVMYAYPWREPGTVLKDEAGPDPWQKKVLLDIAHAVEHGWVENNGVRKDCRSGVYVAVRSGHGVGKSALMAMLDQWFISTHPNPQVLTTANTKEQLTSKTWREMAKWHKLLINRHWFRWTATRFACLSSPETWFSSAIPWSETRPEAFAGTHERYVLVKYDEASAIPDIIWETTEGAMTESKGLKIWIVFGNPTQPTGRFAECWGKQRDRWLTYEVDARESARTDQELIKTWIELYGEDSDFVRVRVKGQPPRGGVTQLIGTEQVLAAMGRTMAMADYMMMPQIMGVDVARFGDDRTVFIKRRGLMTYDLKKHRDLNTQTCAGLIAEKINKDSLDAVFIDMGSTGAAVYDLLIGWGYNQVIGVWSASSADDQKLYANKRAEMWCKMADAIKTGGLCLPDDPELRDDLVGPMYGFDAQNRYQIEKKEDMKKRGLQSPDCADALALTYAYPVAPNLGRRGSGGKVDDGDYNPLTFGVEG